MKTYALATALGLIAFASTTHADLVNLVDNQFGTAAGALFYRSDFRSAGTGVINPFVRLQHDNGPSNNGHSPRNEEQGYNTSGRGVQYDELTDANATRNLRFSDIPIVVIDGIAYLQFILDINEPNGGGGSLLSLDMVHIYTSTIGSQTGLESTLGTLNWSTGAALNDNTVTLDYNLNAGSGQGDMHMYVPLANFSGVAGSDFVYLYSYFGRYMTTDYATGAGFEEWAVRTVPTPASLGVLGLGALVASRRRR